MPKRKVTSRAGLDGKGLAGAVGSQQAGHFLLAAIPPCLCHWACGMELGCEWGVVAARAGVTALLSPLFTGSFV